jgi:hypothetical protein
MTQYAKVQIEATLGGPAEPVVSVAEDIAGSTSNKEKVMNRLWRFFSAVAGRLKQASVQVRVDAVTDYAARITLAITQANIAADEFFDVIIPGKGVFHLVAVSATPDVTQGEFVSETSNAQTATNMAAAVNGMEGLKEYVTATTDSGNLILTAKHPGAIGNKYVVVDGTVNGISGEGNFAGGLDADARVTAAIGCVLANTDADDSVSIGGVSFVAKASGASGDEEFNLGASNVAMADNLVAKINAHPKLVGIVSGVAASGTITLTYYCGPREALLIRLATSDADGLVITQPSTNLTLANFQATRSYGYR